MDTTKQKGFIYSRQGSLFGDREVVGFGDDVFCVKEVARDCANKIITENHYSKKFYNATYIHLGIFMCGEIKGILQYGYAINPASQNSVVANTEIDQYLELNRMWLSDECPRNSESKAISYSIKYIKKKYKSVKWIQSFADERCGKFGIVYQAANFQYYGEHKATFFEYNGEVFHNSIMTDSRKKNTPKGRLLHRNKNEVTMVTLRQFRYLYFIDKRCRKDVMLKNKNAIKHYSVSEATSCDQAYRD